MEVLLFILQKGGVGKTTSAAALASVLTQVHRKRVLLVSMDPQRNLDMICGGLGANAHRHAGAGVQSHVSVDRDTAALA